MDRLHDGIRLRDQETIDQVLRTSVLWPAALNKKNAGKTTTNKRTLKEVEWANNGFLKGHVFRKEIIRGGRSLSRWSVKLATAADARASSLAGMYTAAATGLMAGVVVALFNLAGSNLAARFPLILAGVAAAACFLIGAILCISAIQPADFYLPGCEPDNWKDDIDAGMELDDCLGERAMHIQSDINSNTEVIVRNARLFKWNSRFGIAASFVGLVIWAIAQHFARPKLSDGLQHSSTQGW